MHADLSRLTFDRRKGFTSVVALQGRVLMEADLNESAQIAQQAQRTLVQDLIGAHAGPAQELGFGVGAIMDGTRFDGLYLTPGRYYVDGVALETGADADGELTRPLAFADQPFRRFEDDGDGLPDSAPYFVYLRVFERLVTAVEDPSIRDSALGGDGADSAARAQAVWQAFAVPLDGSTPAARDRALQRWEADFLPGLALTGLGRLAAEVADAPAKQQLCALAPSSRYRGTGNQLYRVEIHRRGDTASDGDPATFKWSRENGATTFAIEDVDDDVVVVERLGRDDRSGLAAGDWVEVVDDIWAGAQRHGRLLEVTDIDPLERRVILDDDVPGEVGHDPDLHPLLRRWDHQERADAPLAEDGAIPIEVGEWVELEDGIRVRFGEGVYRTGDHWVIPARTAKGDVEWPREGGAAVARLPHGIRYAFAPLALVRRITPNVDILDLRCAFAPLPCDEPAEAPPPWEPEKGEVRSRRRTARGRRRRS